MEILQGAAFTKQLIMRIILIFYSFFVCLYKPSHSICNQRFFSLYQIILRLFDSRRNISNVTVICNYNSF